MLDSYRACCCKKFFHNGLKLDGLAWSKFTGATLLFCQSGMSQGVVFCQCCLINYIFLKSQFFCHPFIVIFYVTLVNLLLSVAIYVSAATVVPSPASFVSLFLRPPKVLALSWGSKEFRFRQCHGHLWLTVQESKTGHTVWVGGMTGSSRLSQWH